MSYRRLGAPMACLLGIVCALAACGRPTAPSGAAPPLTASFSIDWGHLTPGRKLQAFVPPTSTVAAPALPGLAANTIPFYSANDPGLTPGVYLADLAAHTTYQVPAFGSHTAPVAVSDGGHMVGLSVDGQLGVLDMQSQLIQVYPQLQQQFITSADVDGYGNIAYTDQDGVVHLLNAVTGQDFIVPTAGLGVGGAANVAVSGDGRFLTYTGLDPGGGTNVFTNDLATGAQLTPPFLGGVAGPIVSLQVSADGASVLFTQAGQLRVLDYATGFIDNLAPLNNGVPVFDATFLNGDPALVGFTRNGAIMVYDRRTHLIDTLPYVNRDLATFGTFF